MRNYGYMPINREGGSVYRVALLLRRERLAADAAVNQPYRARYGSAMHPATADAASTRGLAR